LQDCSSKHYYAPAGKALPAVVLGVTGDTGEIGGQRLALPRDFLRVAADSSEQRLLEDLLRRVKWGCKRTKWACSMRDSRCGRCKPRSTRAMYADWWPVEQIPLSTKHMVGAHRQICLRRRKHPALAGIGFAGRLNPELLDRHAARSARRVLGSQSTPHAGPAAEGSAKQAISAILPLARANSRKSRGDRLLTQRHSRSSTLTSLEFGQLKH